jgi:hypothetical protein
MPAANWDWVRLETSEVEDWEAVNGLFSLVFWLVWRLDDAKTLSGFWANVCPGREAMEDDLLLAKEDEGDLPLGFLVREAGLGGSLVSESMGGDLLFWFGEKWSSIINLTCLLLRYFSYGKLSLLELESEGIQRKGTLSYLMYICFIEFQSICSFEKSNLIFPILTPPYYGSIICPKSYG